MDELAILPRLLEQAAENLRVSRAPRDEDFEELSYALDLTLAALYRFNASRAYAAAPRVTAPVKLVLVASR